MESINGSSKVCSFASLRKVECLVCHKIVFPPVMQCKNRHLICNNCRTNLTSCLGEDCQEEISSGTRSGVSEKFLEKYIVRCKYFKEGTGCLEACLKEEVEEVIKTHEAVCQWREVRCLVPNCNQDVRFASIVQHFEFDHSLQPNDCMLTSFDASEVIMQKKGIVNETCGDKNYKSIVRYLKQEEDVFLAIFRISSLRSSIFELSTVVYPYYSESEFTFSTHICKIKISNQEVLSATYKWEGPLSQIYTLVPAILFPDETTKLKWLVVIDVTKME